MKTLKTTTGGIVIALGVVAAAVGVYLGIWWIQRDSTDRMSRINRRSYEVQKSYVDKARDYIIDIGTTDDAGQMANITLRACGLINDLTIDVPADLARFYGQECS